MGSVRCHIVKEELQKVGSLLRDFCGEAGNKKDVDGTIDEMVQLVEIESCSADSFLSEMWKMILHLNGQRKEETEYKISNIDQFEGRLANRWDNICNGVFKRLQEQITEEMKRRERNTGRNINDNVISDIESNVLKLITFFNSDVSSDSMRANEAIANEYIKLVKEQADLNVKREKLYGELNQFLVGHDDANIENDCKNLNEDKLQKEILEQEAAIKDANAEELKARRELYKCKEELGKLQEEGKRNEAGKCRLEEEIKNLEKISKEINEAEKNKKELDCKISSIKKGIKKLELQIENDKNSGEKKNHNDDGNKGKQKKINSVPFIEDSTPQYFNSESFSVEFILECLLGEEEKKRFQDAINAFFSKRDTLKANIESDLKEYEGKSKEHALWVEALENTKNGLNAVKKTVIEKLTSLFNLNKDKKKDSIIDGYNEGIQEKEGELKAIKSKLRNNLKDLLNLKLSLSLSNEQILIIGTERNKIKKIFDVDDNGPFLKVNNELQNAIDCISMQLQYAEWLINQKDITLGYDGLNDFTVESRNRFNKVYNELIANETNNNEMIEVYREVKENYQNELKDELNRIIKELNNKKSSLEEKKNNFYGEESMPMDPMQKQSRLLRMQKKLEKESGEKKKEILELKAKLKDLGTDKDNCGQTLEEKRKALEKQVEICKKQELEIAGKKTEYNKSHEMWGNVSAELEAAKLRKVKMENLLKVEKGIKAKEGKINEKEGKVKNLIGFKNLHKKIYSGSNKYTFNSRMGEILGFLLSFTSFFYKSINVETCKKVIAKADENFLTGFYRGWLALRGVGVNTKDILNKLGSVQQASHSKNEYVNHKEKGTNIDKKTKNSVENNAFNSPLSLT